MNLVSTCPDIPDNWKGGLGKTAELLGISRITLAKYASLGKSNGGIDWKLSTSGRKVFAGKEVKRFWSSY